MRTVTWSGWVPGWVSGCAVVANGLLAGVYGAFTVAVLPGLAASGDAVLVTVMQQVNRVILTPVFLAVFVAAPVAAVVVAVRAPSPGSVAAAVLAVAAALVTVAVNVPLNDALAAVPVASASPAELAAARAAFEGPWVRANAVRAAAELVACAWLVATVTRG